MLVYIYLKGTRTVITVLYSRLCIGQLGVNRRLQNFPIVFSEEWRRLCKMKLND